MRTWGNNGEKSQDAAGLYAYDGLSQTKREKKARQQNKKLLQQPKKKENSSRSNEEKSKAPTRPAGLSGSDGPKSFKPISNHGTRGEEQKKGHSQTGVGWRSPSMMVPYRSGGGGGEGGRQRLFERAAI